MKAMILAAGRGERLGKLTEILPKPLMLVKGEPILLHHIKNLRAIGINDIVINVSYLADKIITAVGDGSQFGVNVEFSAEPQALETGGGILNALPKLGNEPFIVFNADVWSDYPLQNLQLQSNKMAHVVLVKNPPHNPHGDYGIENGNITTISDKKYTFAGIYMLHPQVFANEKVQKISIIKILQKFIDKQQVSGEIYNGTWIDIGLPGSLQQLNGE